MAQIPTPDKIYCPKCGEPLMLERISDATTMVKLEQSGYIVGARGQCSCGVVAVLAIKAMPNNPTFSLLFNLYELKMEKRK